VRHTYEKVVDHTLLVKCVAVGSIGLHVDTTTHASSCLWHSSLRESISTYKNVRITLAGGSSGMA